MSAHFAKCSYRHEIFFDPEEKTLPPNTLMTADFAFFVSTQKHFFACRRKADLSFPLVLPRYHHLACLPAFVRAALKNYALQVSFHAVYRRKTYAEIPLPPKFIFKDSLAPTKDATFGQKFQ